MNRRSSCACCGVSAVPHEATTGAASRPEHLREIEIAFDEDGESLLSDRALREIQAVERPSLRVNRRLWRVQVLRHLVGIHRASAECDHRPGVAADRHHQPIAEAIDDFSVVALDDQTALQQEALREPLGQQPALQPVARLRRESEPELRRSWLAGTSRSASCCRARPPAGPASCSLKYAAAISWIFSSASRSRRRGALHRPRRPSLCSGRARPDLLGEHAAPRPESRAFS